MLGVVFKYDIFDDPYKTGSVEKGLDKLEAICKKLNRHIFVSYSTMSRNELSGNFHADEYVIVHYTESLSHEEKSEIAECIKESVTLKKSGYKDGFPEIVIVFTKVDKDDVFSYNLK